MAPSKLGCLALLAAGHASLAKPLRGSAPGVAAFNATQEAAAIASCLKSCDAGPACDCETFSAAADTGCPKWAACRSSALLRPAAVADAFVANGASAFATTEDLSHQLQQLDAPQQGPSPNQQWKLTVDDTDGGRRQSIDGFGAAWTDATVLVFDELPSDQQQQVMDDLFGDNGIKLSLMRHTIGQSDLTPSSIGQWSYDENGGQPDTSVSHFDLTDAGSKMVGWLSRMMAARPDVTLFGSPWSPPGWMKASNFNTLQTVYVDAWVQYMIKYLQAFRDRGVKVHAMTMQNEPLHNGDRAWTTYIDQSYSVLLASKLKPAMQAAGLDTQIWAYDHNTDKAGYPEYVFQNAGQYVDAVAWHCYSPAAGWGPLTDFRNQHGNVKQYMTECWTHLQDEGFFELPDFVTGPLQNYASGALAWTLGGSTNYDVSYPGGCGQCSGIVQVDRNSKTYQKTKDFYTLGQWSKFVQKGATFLSGTGSYTYPDGTGVQATNFVNPDGSRVVVIVNKIQTSLNMEIHFSSDTWHATVPGRSVTTWVLPPKTEGLTEITV